MTDVKGLPPVLPVPPEAELHVPLLAGKLMQQVRDTFAAEDWGGLRQSHFRLLTSVPRGGITVTDLAAQLGMTKQAVGQFVTHLTGTGHLVSRVDPADRRLRVVFRTRQGDRTVTAVNDRIGRIERQWERAVGAERYAQFRAVLEDLVVGGRPDG